MPGGIVLLQEAGDRGAGGADDGVPRLQAADAAVGDAHRGIGVGILGNPFLGPHLIEGVRVLVVQVRQVGEVVLRLVEGRDFTSV